MVRKIGLIAFDITRRCTLNCLHCYNHSGENNEWKELSDEKLDRILRDLASVEPDSFCICGGEPLLRKERAFSFVEEGKQKYPSMDINMVTNGELVTREVAERMVTSNLSSIQFSMDGASSKTHDWLRNKQGVFQKVIQAIKYVDEERARYNSDLLISIAFCPTKENIHEIDTAIKLCEELHVELFRVQPLMLIGRAEKNLNEKLLNRKEYSELSRKLHKRKIDHEISSRIMVDWIDPLDHIMVDDSKEISFIQVNASGDLLLSPYIPIAVGNLKNHSIHEYLERDYFELWDHKLFQLMKDSIKSAEQMNLLQLRNELPSVGKGVIAFDALEDDCIAKMDAFYEKLIRE